MATQLTIVNNVLRRLRENTVSSVADNAYSQLIAMWVNDAIREVTAAYDWKQLDHTVEVTIAATTSNYDLTDIVSNGGNVENTGRATNIDSMLRWDDKRARPMAFWYDSSASSEDGDQLWLLTEDERRRRELQDQDDTTATPGMFSLNMAAAGDGYEFNLWPIPSENGYVRLVFNSPQVELAIDGTDDATSIIVPNAPVEAHVAMIAANERGEEIGEPGNLLERRYQTTLSMAIEAAMSNDNRANRYESWRD
jgi:hypothetical protein